MMRTMQLRCYSASQRAICQADIALAMLCRPQSDLLRSLPGRHPRPVVSPPFCSLWCLARQHGPVPHIWLSAGILVGGRRAAAVISAAAHGTQPNPELVPALRPCAAVHDAPRLVYAVGDAESGETSRVCHLRRAPYVCLLAVESGTATGAMHSRTARHLLPVVYFLSICVRHDWCLGLRAAGVPEGGATSACSGCKVAAGSRSSHAAVFFCHKTDACHALASRCRTR
jgi:hypothetical protein